MSPEWEDAPNLSRLLGGLEEAMGWHEPAKVCANCRWVRQAKESDTMPYWGVYCADPKQVERVEDITSLITNPLQRDSECWEAPDD